jgi:hypothetical protein
MQYILLYGPKPLINEFLDIFQMDRAHDGAPLNAVLLEGDMKKELRKQITNNGGQLPEEEITLRSGVISFWHRICRANPCLPPFIVGLFNFMNPMLLVFPNQPHRQISDFCHHFQFGAPE